MNTNSKHTVAGKVVAEGEWDELKCPSIPGRVAMLIEGPGWGDGTFMGCVEPVCYGT